MKMKKNVWITVSVLMIALIGGGVWGVIRSWEKSLLAVDETLKHQLLPDTTDSHRRMKDDERLSVQNGSQKQAESHEKSPFAQGAKSAHGQDLSEESDLSESVVAPLRADLDSNNPKIVVEAVKKFMQHPNPAVRLKAVEALNGTGQEGFDELNKMLRDKNPEVARAALDAWSIAVQSIDYSDKKVANIKEVGEIAAQSDADAFQDVLEAMFDLPDSVVLPMLMNYAGETQNPEILEKIIDKFNFCAQPDEQITSVDQMASAYAEYNKRQAEEAAQEAGSQSTTTTTTGTN